MVLKEGLSSFVFKVVKLKTSLGLCEEELSSIISVLEGGFWGLLSSSSSLRSSDCESVEPSRVQYSPQSLILSLSNRSNSICSILSLVLASCSSLSLVFVSSRSFLPCSKESFFLGMQGLSLSVPYSGYHCFLLSMSFPEDVWIEHACSCRSVGSYKMSEFRHDYARNYTIPFPIHQLLCPNKTDTIKTQWRRWRKRSCKQEKVFPPQV